MTVLGLTGKSGSGKSVVADYLKQFSASVIDCDKLYSEMVSSPSECTQKIASVFGTEVLNSDGSLNRKALGALVFGKQNKSRLELLNRTVHPLVLKRIREILNELSKSGCKLCVIDAPQLFEAGVNSICDYTLAVTAHQDLRIDRIVNRDNISVDSAKARISSQLEDSYFVMNADFVIDNSSSLDELYLAVDNVLKKICVNGEK